MKFELGCQKQSGSELAIDLQVRAAVHHTAEPKIVERHQRHNRCMTLSEYRIRAQSSEHRPLPTTVSNLQ
jgi:hypothetical protein